MRKDITVAATPRPARGKNEARRLRVSGLMPAIIYGTGKDPVARSLKAPSPRAATYRGKGRAPEMAAPLDLVPSALRVNPVKSAPGSLAIQGHMSSNVRRQQGKRDSR